MRDVQRADSGDEKSLRTPPGSVEVGRFVGRAGEFHARDVPEDQSVHIWWFETTVDAVVLGSSQSIDLVDVEACRRHGVDIVRRRSGGGMVLLTRSGTLWLDVVVPSEHRLWDADVTTSSFWLGEVWMEAIESFGIESLVQHRSRFERSPLAELVCFAGRGPGEIFLATGEKVVGISQRRTRRHARFQCAVSLDWDPHRLVELMRPPHPEIELLETAGSTLQVDPRVLASKMDELLVARLSQ